MGWDLCWGPLLVGNSHMDMGVERIKFAEGSACAAISFYYEAQILGARRH